MSDAVRDFVDAAAAGRPVYMSSVRERFEALPPSASFRFIARLDGFDAWSRIFTFTLPKLTALAPDERAMVTEYVLAGLYNVISTLGGRGLVLESHGDAGEGAELATAFEREFGIGEPRTRRRGYGRAVNVSERMDEAISPAGTMSAGAFQLIARDSVTLAMSSFEPDARAGIAELCKLATSALAGTAICGIDVGGTDIKLCLAVGGKVARFLEYDWFPSVFTTADEIIDPIVTLVRLMRLDGARASGSRHAGALTDVLAPAFVSGASAATIEAVVRAGEALLSEPFALDAIGVSFPDVVVRDRIVGGEGYKTRGLRDHLGAAYEAEFRRLSGLHRVLSTFVKPDGIVGIVNDGPMAAFAAAVELSAIDPTAIQHGVFAHTLGTELGTGWVTQDGTFPEIPLEIYNCIIDIGSYPERKFGADDIRSVNNFNTGLPGTLQKYASQSGVFRLAAKYLPDEDPATFAELLEHGMFVESDDGLFVQTDPRDMRKQLLEVLMQAVEVGGHPAVDRIFREIGRFIAAAWLETKWLLDPATDQRILFGRLVKSQACFDLMVDGARTIAPDLELVRADVDIANTDLMRQLRDSERYTVAQFGQAVGAVHYANYRRHGVADARREVVASVTGDES